MAHALSEPTFDDSQTRTIEKWAAIAGRWQFQGTTARYLGPDDPKSRPALGIAPQSRPALGIAIGSARFRDGDIETRIRLSRNERTSAGIVFGFQSLESPYLIASIGGFDNAYSIAEYRPGLGWFSYAGAGSLSNVSADEDHSLVLKVRGQSVRLTVDDVDVLDVLLHRPIEGTGTGLYAWDDGPTIFQETIVSSLAPRVFVIMPFAEPFDTLYRDVIAPVAKGLGFNIIRVDEIPGPGIILDDIQQQIEQAHAVVAEISTNNPNVFYELGFAHALKKPAVLLLRRGESQNMPFDVRGYRAIFYDDTIGGKKAVERHLHQHLHAVKKGMPESGA